MTSGGQEFKEGYRFWARCHGLIWKWTASERLCLKRFPVCPKCGESRDMFGRRIPGRVSK